MGNKRSRSRKVVSITKVAARNPFLNKGKRFTRLRDE